MPPTPIDAYKFPEFRSTRFWHGGCTCWPWKTDEGKNLMRPWLVVFAIGTVAPGLAVGSESEGRRLAVRGPECCNVRDGHYPADVDRPAPHAGRDRSEKANRSGLGAGLQGHEGAGARAGEKSRPGGQQVRPVHRSRSRRKRER